MEKLFRNYVVVALLVAGLLFGGHEAWQQSVKLGCLPVGGVAPQDAWLNDCSSDRIGDVDHATFWFATEPTLASAITSAKVLFFGDSRILNALSSQKSVVDWFRSRSIPFYLLAFTFGEQSGWAQRLLAKYQPHPAVMVFDTDPYFTGGESPPAQAVQSNPQAELAAALDVKAFVAGAAGYCAYLPFLCGRTPSSYRSNADGHLILDAPERFFFGVHRPGRFPITPPLPTDRSSYEAYLGHAREVLKEVSIDPRCVVFTLVPNSDRDDSLARFLALRLGARVIAPPMADLTTSDHMHLTADSAQLWTAAVFKELGPIVQECLAKTGNK